MRNSLQIPYNKLREQVEHWKNRLQLDNDDVKPLFGTDVNGMNTHQYIRLAIVSLKSSGRPRSFMLFVESDWLKQKINEYIQNPSWLSDKIWDNKWAFIEEILHKPTPGELLVQYSKELSNEEDSLWMAIYEFLEEQGILKKVVTQHKSSKIPENKGI